MYKFSPGLGTPLKYNPCDGKVCTESTVKFPSSPTKVKSNSALTANENAEAVNVPSTKAFLDTVLKPIWITVTVTPADNGVTSVKVVPDTE